MKETWRTVHLSARAWGGLLAAVALCAMPHAAPAAQESDGWPAGVLRLSVDGREAPSGEAEEGDEPLRVSMEFQDANIKDVLKVFSQQTGINVIAGEDIKDQAITLYLEDVSVLDAMDQILRASHLSYEQPPGSDIYIVKSIPEGPPATITRVYRLKYARVSKSVLAKAASTLNKRTPFEASAGVVTPSSAAGGLGAVGATGAAGGAAAGGTEEGVGVDAVLQELLTEHGRVVVDGRTNSLILTDIPENFPRLEAALIALDIRTPQIMVDAEVIETTLAKVKALGFQWGTGTEGELFTLTPGSRQSRFPWVEDLFGENRAPSVPAGTPSSIDPAGPLRFSATTLSLSSAAGVLKALESDTDTKILARPKILTLDNESALIRLTTDETIGFESTETGEAGNVRTEPERTTTGILLVVTPQVNEGGYVTMLVEPVVTLTVVSKITPPSGTATTRDPRTRSSRTLVRVRSGDTLVVGGLINRSDEEVVRRVPGLSGIPFLGEAFKKVTVDDSATELLVFLTPRILDDRNAKVAVSPGAPGPREQEPAGGRQSTIEESLNQLEQSRL